MEYAKELLEKLKTAKGKEEIDALLKNAAKEKRSFPLPTSTAWRAALMTYRPWMIR